MASYVRLPDRQGAREEVIMFRILTVTREYGSGGSVIAKKVAEQLGWNLLDREFIGAVARSAHIDAETVGKYDEQVDSWWRKFHHGGLRAAAIYSGATPNDVQFVDAETMATFTRRVIAQAAANGNCVIVGRGAQCVLRGCKDAFHVFIYSPWEERASRVRNRVKSPEDVCELIRLADHERATYVQTYYRCDWKDPHLYHMMISTQLGTETAAEMIVDAVEGGGLAC